MKDKILPIGLLLGLAAAALMVAGFVAQVLAAAGFLVVSGIGYYIVQTDMISNLADQYRESNSISTMSPDQIKEVLDEFAKRNYPEEKRTTLRWDMADMDTKKLPEWGEELKAVTGVIGQNNTKIQVFIETNSKSIKTHKKIRHDDQELYPYKYCDYYQGYKQSTRSGSLNGHNPQQNMQNFGGTGMNPFVIQTSSQNNQSNKSGEDEE